MSQQKLDQNTTSLQEVLASINALPEAGGSAAPTLQDKTITENGTYTADNGYDGLGTVTVNVASSGGGGGYTLDDFADGTVTGALVLSGTTVRNYCFYNFRTITSISCPNMTTIGQYSFSYCVAATSISFPVLTSVPMGGLRNNNGLTTVCLPKATSVLSYAFAYCGALEKVDLPLCTSLDQYSIGYCGKLKHLILRSATVCTLKNVNCFVNTEFASGKSGGYVYVPRNLVSTYQTATNWSGLAVTFRAIEDYPDICG